MMTNGQIRLDELRIEIEEQEKVLAATKRMAATIYRAANEAAEEIRENARKAATRIIAEAVRAVADATAERPYAGPIEHFAAGHAQESTT